MCDNESPERFVAEFLCVAESDRVEVWTVLYWRCFIPSFFGLFCSLGVIVDGADALEFNSARCVRQEQDG
jgi:hypothetical protein